MTPPGGKPGPGRFGRILDECSTCIIVIHLMLVLALIGVVLLQRSEGGGLGIGSTGGFMTSRGTANVLTRATAILAGLFFVTSLLLSILAGVGRKPTSSRCRRGKRAGGAGCTGSAWGWRRRAARSAARRDAAGRAGGPVRAAGAAVEMKQNRRAGKSGPSTCQGGEKSGEFEGRHANRVRKTWKAKSYRATHRRGAA